MSQDLVPQTQWDALKVLMHKVEAIGASITQRSNEFEASTLRFDFDHDVHVECYVNFDNKNFADEEYLNRIAAMVVEAKILRKTVANP